MENTNCEKYGLYKSNGDVSDTGKGTGKENLAGKMCDIKSSDIKSRTRAPNNRLRRHTAPPPRRRVGGIATMRIATASWIASPRHAVSARSDRARGALASTSGTSPRRRREQSSAGHEAVVDGTEVVAGRRGGASSLASGCEHAVPSGRGTRDWRRRGGSAPGRRRDPRGRGHVARRRAGAPPRGAGAVGHVQPGAAVHIR